MKKALLAICMALLATSVCADQYVHGYTKSDGTYVQGYHRSSPNQYRYDNYSSQGNTNPYTGRRGYQPNEFSNPPVYNKTNPSGWPSSNSYGGSSVLGGATSGQGVFGGSATNSNCFGLVC